MKLTPTQKAYIAGFLDADGSISIAGSITKKGHQHWALQLYFWNCNIDVLEKIRNWAGIGSIRERNRSNKWNISRSLKFQGLSAVNLLKQVKPYLIVKKEQAKIAIEFSKTFSDKNLIGSSWQGGRKLTQKTIKKRILLKKKLQSLTLIANYLGKNINNKEMIFS